MSRREYDNSKSHKEFVDELTITASQTISAITLANMLAKGATTINMFIVGGGGGGTGDNYTSDAVGCGGCGAQCLSYENIALIASDMSIEIGAGGINGNPKTDIALPNGGNTTVIYNGITYIAKGGYGGANISGGYEIEKYYNYTVNTIFNVHPREGRSFCGCCIWQGTTATAEYIKTYYDFTPEQYMALYPENKQITFSIKGENGKRNPFDEADTMVYGCGGGSGYDAYRNVDFSATYPNYGGDNNAGGGRGGYGKDNTPENAGVDATSYGSGGGGGAFSSKHTYSYGGKGKQGIVKLYFYK